MTEKDEGRMFTQDELNKLVGDARAEGREKGADKARAELRAELEELRTFKAQAAEQEEKLTRLQETLDSYKGTLDGVFEAAVSGLDDKAKKAVEDLPFGIVDKLSWLNKHGGLFTALEGAVGTPRAGAKPIKRDDDGPRKRLTL